MYVDGMEDDNEQILFSHFHPPFTLLLENVLNLLHLCMKSYMNQILSCKGKSHKFPHADAASSSSSICCNWSDAMMSGGNVKGVWILKYSSWFIISWRVGGMNTKKTLKSSRKVLRTKESTAKCLLASSLYLHATFMP